MEAKAKAVGKIYFKLAIFDLLRHRLADHKRLELRSAGNWNRHKHHMDDCGGKRLSCVFVAPHFARKGCNRCNCTLPCQAPVPQTYPSSASRDHGGGREQIQPKPRRLHPISPKSHRPDLKRPLTNHRRCKPRCLQRRIFCPDPHLQAQNQCSAQARQSSLIRMESESVNAVTGCCPKDLSSSKSDLRSSS